jgi:pimeloyl-ACP methyl ester carboxylesterase
MDARTRQEPAGSATDAARSVRRAPAPPAVKALRFWFGSLGRVLPGPMTGLAYRLWFTTRRFRLSERERRILGEAERFTVRANGEPVVAYAWGQGPVVFLVHGWHGSAAHFVEFVQPLTDAGFRAVALDAPAHGESPGTRTSLPKILDAMDAVAERSGPMHALVGHSFGVVCATSALVQKRVAASKAVCISPPAHMGGLLESFSSTLGLPGGVQARMRARLEREFGADIMERFSPVNHAAVLAMPALIVHDGEDRSVPVAEAELLARTWPGAQFMRIEKLGHRRILGDAEVISRVVTFLR